VRGSHVAAAWRATAPELDPVAGPAEAERLVRGKPCARQR
jgi:hypothetical protein